MSAILFTTATPSLGEFLGNGNFFRIPDFQRDYSWKEDNWEDLWIDSLRVWQEGQPHFMGALVLQEDSDKKEYKIIDGQQRTTTLSVLIIAIINLLIDYGYENEGEEVRKKYIGEVALNENLSFKIKLGLNQRDNQFYYESLAKKLKKPLAIKTLPKSQQGLWGCYEFFYNKLKNQFVENINLDKQSLLDFLVEGVAQKLLFIRINVKDELSAYTMFETLNGTGLKLTTADMIKNYLFSITHNISDIFENTKAKWRKITDDIEEDEFSDFLRYVWSATRKSITKKELLKEVKNLIKTTNDVENILEELEKFAEIYVALSDYDSLMWEPEQKEYIYILSKILTNKQYKILMMVAKLKLENSDFTKLLKNIVTFVFRFQEIANITPNRLEPIYSKIAVSLYKEEIVGYPKIKEKLQENNISDSKFRVDFENWEPTKNKIVRYALISLENKITNGNRSIFENETIEHVLPQSPSDSWADFGQQKTIQQNIYKIGNLTLLEKTKNKKLSNLSFEEKKQEYVESGYEITKLIAEDDLWNQDAVQKRQKHFAKLALEIWKIS
jgi:uncharacterized protein with ParB-like and HNH nuclease domain